MDVRGETEDKEGGGRGIVCPCNASVLVGLQACIETEYSKSYEF
jgi:hypothetical protein